MFPSLPRALQFNWQCYAAAQIVFHALFFQIPTINNIDNENESSEDALKQWRCVDTDVQMFRYEGFSMLGQYC